MNPLVSVVIPTYNQPALLLETLETVAAQTFTDFEIVVVNDGCTDDTLERLAGWGKQEPRLRVVSQPNAGIGAARNRGIDEARGKYVALLDHDDLWMPDKLAAQVDFFARHPECATVLVPWAYSTQPGACSFDAAGITDENGIMPHPMAVAATGVVFLLSSSIMFDRARAAGLRYATERQSIEDLPFQIGLFARGPVGIAEAKSGKVLMVYRVHAANYSSQAVFFDNGLRMMRRLARQGAFADLPRRDQPYLQKFLAHLAHTTAVRQLRAGRRARGMAVWLRELPALLRRGHWKFALAFPWMSILPMAAVRRRWPLTGLPAEK